MDESAACNHLLKREAVNHSAKEFVRGIAHTNGIESFWALLKRGHYGTNHQMSAKQLDRLMNDFAGQHYVQTFDTLDQMAIIARGLDDKWLRYADLVAC